jgi:hypothetical protein
MFIIECFDIYTCLVRSIFGSNFIVSQGLCGLSRKWSYKMTSKMKLIFVIIATAVSAVFFCVDDYVVCN